MEFMYSDPYLMEEVLVAVVSALTSSIPSLTFGVISYVLTSLGLYTVAARRGIEKPWLSWIPVLNMWILGSLSDQYRYVVKGQVKSKRKVLLVLEILTFVLSVLILIICGVMTVELIGGAVRGINEDAVLEMVMGPVIAMVGLCLPLMGVSIAAVVIRYMALYDLYTSMDPANSVLFLVLSILISVTEPFFLFFSRNKDLGMPPRKEPQTPAQIPCVPAEDVAAEPEPGEN